MNVFITGSKKSKDGEITVYFKNDAIPEISPWYYTHGITKIGEPTDSDGLHNSMWAWINHMSHKRWWNAGLEKAFITEVSKHLYG